MLSTTTPYALLMQGISVTTGQCLTVLHSIDDDAYIDQPVFSSSIGAHMRHIIEFFVQLQSLRTGETVDYDNRQRNLLLETNRDAAIKKLEANETSFLSWLSQHPPLHTPVQLRQMVLTHTDPMITTTTLAREIVATLDHATHHLAFIKLIAATQECALPDEIGTAVATRQYLHAVAAQCAR